MQRTSRIRLPSLSVSAALFALAIPSLATADEHDGVGIGARAEAGIVGIGFDYWRGAFGISAAAGGSRATLQADTAGSSLESATARGDEADLGASLGALYAIASGERARLAVGARLAYRRLSSAYDGFGETTYDLWAAQVPVRLQVFVVPRVALHTELGLDVTLFGVSTAILDENGAPDGTYEQRSRRVGVFGHPLGNVGVTYYF